MGQVALIAEALAACAATGVDLRKYYEVVSAGGANSGIFQMIVPKLLDEGDTSGLRFSLPNGEKDLRYYQRMTEAASLAGGLGQAVHGAFAKGLELGLNKGYVGALIEAQALLNGIEIVPGGAAHGKGRRAAAT